MKVNLFDRKLLELFYKILSVISVITSIVFIFIDIPMQNKLIIGLVVLVFLIILYCILWWFSNKKTHINLNIEGSPVEIKFGDIFNEEGLKVIAFNEYFDTLVDNKIIAENTLNGFFIKKFIKNISLFDEQIYNDLHLQEKVIGTNENRLLGKKTKYKLGSIFKYQSEYLLTAFSRFDENNRAYLSMQDYISCLLEFWNEIDIIYAGRTIVIPLLGSGITRFRGYENVSEQELLELLLWTFKVSRIRFRYPSKVSIVVGYDKRDKVSLFQLANFNK